MKFSFLYLIYFAVLSCKSQDEEVRKFKFDCSNGVQWKHIKLTKVRNFQKMVVLENTLDDSCKIGIMVVPPSKLGLLYDIEFILDSISYNFIPYKATKGKLVIEHVFSD